MMLVKLLDLQLQPLWTYRHPPRLCWSPLESIGLKKHKGQEWGHRSQNSEQVWETVLSNRRWKRAGYTDKNSDVRENTIKLGTYVEFNSTRPTFEWPGWTNLFAWPSQAALYIFATTECLAKPNRRSSQLVSRLQMFLGGAILIAFPSRTMVNDGRSFI